MPIELSVWLTPAIVIAVTALLLRSNARLEERLSARIDNVNKNLGARIDETNKRIDEVNKSLGARIDETNKRIDETNKRIEDVSKSLGARLDETNKRIGETNKRIEGIDSRLRAVEHGQARLEGLLDGLREAISGRRPAA